MLVVIQAGHAGRTTGATGAPGEQAFTIDARTATLQSLRAAGIPCHGIDADEPDSAYNGDAFVAIHCDGGAPTQHGASVGWQTPQGHDLAGLWKHHYTQLGWTRGFHPDNYTDNLHFYYGVRNAVRQDNRVAMIIECGFITNPFDRAIMSPEIVAESITRTIIDYFNLERKVDMTNTELQKELPEGRTRGILKGLVAGTVLETVRQPHRGDDTFVVGILREPLKNLFREVLREAEFNK